MDVHYQSKEHTWETPDDIFQELDEEFHFTLDPCADHDNAKCKKYYTLQDNGLAKDWHGEVVFCNPPYGNQIQKWVKKCYWEAKKGAVCVMLIPSRTDTKWWHEFVMSGEVRFVRGRIKFKGAKASAPFTSSIIIFREDDNKLEKRFISYKKGILKMEG